MKRLAVFLLLLPSLGSCSIDDNYYNNDYRREPGPTVKVEAPASSFNHYHNRNTAHGNYHQHDDRRVVVQENASNNSSNHHGHGQANGTNSNANNGDITNHGHD